MSISIRILSEKDALSYRSLRLYSYRESPFAFSESYEDETSKSVEDFANDIQISGSQPEKFVLGAFTQDDTLVGFVTFKRDQRTKARHKAMLHAMYTHPASRNKGIGRMLVEKAILMAKEIHGLEQIHAWVLHVTGSATAFYIKNGFVSQGTIVKNDLKIGDTYADAEYMVLYL